MAVPADFTPYVIAIDHVGLAVNDLDAAIDFYGRAFGMELVHEEINEEQGVREAMVAVGDSGSCLQLLAPLREDSPIGKFLARQGEGIDGFWIIEQMKLEFPIGIFGCAVVDDGKTDLIHIFLEPWVGIFATELLHHLRHCFQPECNFLLFGDADVLIFSGDRIVDT